MKRIKIKIITAFIFIGMNVNILPSAAQTSNSNPALDEKVRKFLNDHSRRWYDMNIPAVDGQLLYDIIVKNNYKSALEIGNSTGHSGIWID